MDQTPKKSCNDYIVDNLCCTICKEFIIGDISQCQNGHIYCAACIAQIGRCSLCKVILLDKPIRALFLENVRETIELRCERKLCGFYGSYLHVNECKFHMCKNTPCGFVGTLEQLNEHLKHVCQYRKITCPWPECGKQYKCIEVDHEHFKTHAINGTNILVNGQSINMRFTGSFHTYILIRANPDRFLVKFGYMDWGEVEVLIVEQWSITCDHKYKGDSGKYRLRIDNKEGHEMSCSFKMTNGTEKLKIPEHYRLDTVGVSVLFN